MKISTLRMFEKEKIKSIPHYISKQLYIEDKKVYFSKVESVVHTSIPYKEKFLIIEEELTALTQFFTK